VVSADRQRAGRGRRGRRWLSDRPDNIYCSIGLVLEITPEALGLLPLLTGVCLAEALQRQGFQPRLKWPNDLLIGGRKLGGILIENRALGSDRHALTVGFGLNRRLDPEQLRTIGQPARARPCCTNCWRGFCPSCWPLAGRMPGCCCNALPSWTPTVTGKPA